MKTETVTHRPANDLSDVAERLRLHFLKKKLEEIAREIDPKTDPGLGRRR